MEMWFLWGLAILALGARRATALNQLAVISGDSSEAQDKFPNTVQVTALATTEQPHRFKRWQRPADRYAHEEYQEEEVENVPDHHHQDDQASDMMKAVKPDYWGGYYDFLINEGSYKFWAVFQLATAALLIYSGFAALYYAKVNPAISDDDDDFMMRRRRRRRSIGRYRPPRERPFWGLEPQLLQLIMDAIVRKVH